jgi:hypothetical protein
MIPMGNFVKNKMKFFRVRAVLDLSKSFKYSKNIPTLNLRGESCD